MSSRRRLWHTWGSGFVDTARRRRMHVVIVLLSKVCDMRKSYSFHDVVHINDTCPGMTSFI